MCREGRNTGKGQIVGEKERVWNRQKNNETATSNGGVEGGL